MNRRSKFLNFVLNPINVNNVLVIRNGMIGDIVSITPVLIKLIETYPSVKIDLIIGSKAVDVLKNFPNVRNIYPFTFNYSIVSILKQIVFFSGLARGRYDVVIVQEVNTHFSLMAKLVRAKFTVGFENNVSWLYDYSVKRPLKTMAIAETETVLSWTEPDSNIKTALFVSTEEREKASRLLETEGINPHEKFLLIHPGSHSANSYRQWMSSGYADVADYFISEYGWKVVFTGIERDSDVINNILKKMKYPGISVAGKINLREFIAVIQAASLVIGPDTGTLHIAAAVDSCAIMLMGISDPMDTGVYHPGGKAKIVRSNLPCSPCANSVIKPEQWKICVNMHPVECMRQLNPEMVIRAAKELIINNI